MDTPKSDKTQENIDTKETQRERLVERLQATYNKADDIKRKIGLIDTQLRELYNRQKYERSTKGNRN